MEEVDLHSSATVSWDSVSLLVKQRNQFNFCKDVRMITMARHSSTLAWRIPWMDEPGGLQSMGSLRVGHDWATSLSLSCIGEGNGNPLQCSCLENPRDGGAWWAAIYGVAQSWTRLKRLSLVQQHWWWFCYIFLMLYLLTSIWCCQCSGFWLF